MNRQTYALSKVDVLVRGKGESVDHLDGDAEWSAPTPDTLSRSGTYWGVIR